MSTFVDGLVVCRACAHRYPAEIADAVHVSTRRELRDAILAGELHRFMCPRCGGSTTVEKLFAYTDFDRFHWFVVVPGAELPFVDDWERFAEETFAATMRSHCPPMVRDEWAPRMQRRVVFGLAALREKLMAADAGLDDRVLEGMKLGVLLRGGILPSAGEHLHLVGVDGVSLWLCHARGSGTVSFSVPRSWYVEAEAAFARAEGAQFGGLVVDYRAALVERGAV
ncbi:MAG: CpXC domain-containing protein [Myxococcales bacterium]|nr:CpXC domain-containing protein [Myxococcales bacterium]